MATEFSRTLSLLRKERGVSQRVAAADLGVSQALLSHYENGIREPGLAFVSKVCDYYHVSADYMLGRTLARDGSMLTAEEILNAAEPGNVLQGSVLATIEKTIETRHLEDLIHIVSIPMETVTEITDNGPKTYDRKVFPGYVLIKMIMSDEAWYIIKNVRGVTGFVGSGTKPTPLTEEEVQQLGIEKHEIVVAYSEGDSVRINDGPLTSFIGTVDQIDIEKNKVRVIVSMFGRETPVELELDQVELVND